MEQKYELYHHGILGMKWGIRRFQNEDGSYTKRGLERYKRSEKNYLDLKKDYKLKKASKSDVRSAKKEYRKNYHRLVGDYRADKGKELYRSGITINSTKRAATIGLLGVGVGSVFALSGLRSLASSWANDYKKFAIANLAGYATVGAAVLGASAISVSAGNNVRNLRAYYAHSSPKDNTKGE